MIKCTRTERKFKVDFLENKASNEKFSFYIFDFFFRVESPPFRLYHQLPTILYIKSSEKFLSFCKEIMDALHFPFYIILSNYILFYQNKDHNVRQIKFHVYIKMHRCKRRVCRRKTLLGQPNIYTYRIIYLEILEIRISNDFYPM